MKVKTATKTKQNKQTKEGDNSFIFNPNHMDVLFFMPSDGSWSIYISHCCQLVMISYKTMFLDV